MKVFYDKPNSLIKHLGKEESTEVFDNLYLVFGETFSDLRIASFGQARVHYLRYQHFIY